jgi:hypothetical protein
MVLMVLAACWVAVAGAAGALVEVGETLMREKHA